MPIAVVPLMRAIRSSCALALPTFIDLLSEPRFLAARSSPMGPIVLSEEAMPIMAMFEVKGATSTKYDEVLRRLTEIGQRVPTGQVYHICYGDRQNLQVINVFENQANLDAFCATIGPILQDMGIEAKPAVFEVYNIIEG